MKWSRNKKAYISNHKSEMDKLQVENRVPIMNVQAIWQDNIETPTLSQVIEQLYGTK